jgi:DNA (cytosine-5)-methyltransferase 1
MSVSYSRLWKLLIDKNMNKSQLRDAAGISTNAVAKLGRNEAVSLDTLEKVCCALNCNIEDVLEFVKVSEVFPHDHS